VQVIAHTVEVEQRILDKFGGIAAQQAFAGAAVKMVFAPLKSPSGIVWPIALERKRIRETEDHVLRHARTIIVREISSRPPAGIRHTPTLQ
jgi:hypothetical protein